MPKKWLVPAPAPDLSAYDSLIPWVEQTLRRGGLLMPPEPRPFARLIGQVLANRGIAPVEAEQFFEGGVEHDDPFVIKGMHDAVKRIRCALEHGERIAVYGDYDVDGVSATAVLMYTFEALGANALAYIPHRVDDGYGLNNESLDGLKAQGVQLVISVDCGVRAHAEAAHARSIGLDLIITDHHAVPETLPDALVINVRQRDCPYPFKELAGVGHAYKLAQALLLAAPDTTPARVAERLHIDRLLDLVALGTVADVVVLKGENRDLVRRGLALINESPRTGLRALMQKAGVRTGSVDAGAIGFALGPRLNAAGRMEHATVALELLMCTDPVAAERLATRLDEANRERQELTKTCVDHARETIRREQQDAPLIFVHDPGYPQGIVGLIAGRLAEEFYRPAVVIDRQDGISKGSARSIPEFNIVEALEACRDLLTKFGGHAAAAGFSLPTSRLPELHACLTQKALEQFGGQSLVPTLRADADVSFRELDRPLLFLLELMEPCGMGNPAPMFVAHNVSVRSVRSLGSEREHLRLGLEQRDIARAGVAFRQAKLWNGKLPPRIDIAFSFEWNDFNGTRGMQLKIKDIKRSVAGSQSAHTHT